MKIYHASLWFVLLSMAFSSCTADEPAKRSKVNTSDALVDCVDNDESDLALLASDIVIDEGEIEGEIVPDAPATKIEEGLSKPCAPPKTKKIKGEVENTKIPMVIGIPEADPLTDERAIAYLQGACLSCHHAETGSVKSFWGMDPELTKDKLKIDPLAAAVYYSLVVKAKGIVAKPRAMPDRELTSEEAKDLPGLIRWFEEEMPVVVASASHKFGAGTGSSVGVTLNYRCENPVTFRKYMQRLTNDAFDRNPTIEEIQELASGDPDTPVSRADRQRLVDHMFENESWRQQFLDVGLRKFADKVGGSGDILPYGSQISPEAAEDLREEFYQYIKKYIDKKTWKEILLADSVMVTANTAGFYENCAVPSAGWAECKLAGKRGSYFSTIGYLRSKSSSFLMENNNYGRAALMHFIISGDVFKAAFDEDSGGAVKELPSCLESNDWRGRVEETAFAPFGSTAIPGSGNLCQSCHIDRQMAAGSMLFRPYNKAGLIFGRDVVLTEDEDFDQAIDGHVSNRPSLDENQQAVVDEAFLQSLLAETSGACMPKRGTSPETPFASVGDLAAFIVGDGRILAGGLSRHMPRSMSNLLNTTEEIIVRINNAYFDENEGGMLIPVFKAYFSSETFACEAKELEQ